MNGDLYLFVLDFEDGRVYKYLYPEVVQNEDGKVVENDHESYLVQLGHKNQVKATEKQKKDLRKLLAIDPDVKEQFDHAKTLQSVLNL